MSGQSRRRAVVDVFQKLGLEPPAEDWSGVDPVLPLLERMRQDGAVVLLKWDGERRTQPYTVVAAGPPLAGDTLRTDAASLEDALAKVLLEYAARAWGA